MRTRPSTMGAFVVALCLLQGAIYAQDGDTGNTGDIGTLIEDLASGTNQEVQDARVGLVALATGGNEILGRRIARELTNAKVMTSDNVLVRLNTILVARSLAQGSGVALLLQGLEDENVAVRYQAAKSIALLAARQDPPQLDWDAVIDAAAARSLAEENDRTQRLLLQALIGINKPKARQAAADLMIRRSDLHLADASIPLHVEADAFKKILQAIFDQVQKNQTLDEDLLVKASIAGLRYMQVSATHLMAGGLAPDVQDQHVNIFKSGQAVLRYVARQHWDQPAPAEIDGDNWERNLDRVNDLVQKMTQPPFDLPKAVFEPKSTNAI